jgi:hypothetical protein
MKKALFLLILILFVSPATVRAQEAVPATQQPVSASNPGAVVTIVDGSAQLFMPGTAKGSPLTTGNQVVKDNEIRVGANSRVELRMPDGSFLRLAQKTRITISQLEFDGNTSRKNYRVDLVVGRLWAKVKKLLTPDSSLTIHMVTMTVGVRGTTFGVDIKADKSGQLKVYEGEVSAGPGTLDNALAGTIVQAGQLVTVSSRSVLSKPRPFDPQAETSEWSRWNQERDRLVEQGPESAKPSEGPGPSSAAGAAPAPGVPAGTAGAPAVPAAGAAATVAGAIGAAGAKSDQAENAPATQQPAGESKVVVEIPRTQWCQCVRALLGVEGGNIAGCVKSGASEEKLKIFRQRGTGGERSTSVSFLLSFAGCTEKENENVGSLSFNVQWEGQPAGSAAAPPVPSYVPITCDAGGISGVHAMLYRTSKGKLASAGPWSCSNPIGTLSNIPAGPDVGIVIRGKNASGAVLYRGDRTGITITYAQTTALGAIEAVPFTPVLSAPANAALLGSGRVHFTWTGPRGAVSYQIQVSDNPDFTSTIIDAATKIASYETGTDLASRGYFWRVKAKDEFNDSSDWSVPGTLTVDADPPINTTTEKCINKGAAATNSRNVTLSISATKKTGVTGYFISEEQKKPGAGKKGWVAIPSIASYAADIPYTLSKGDGKKKIYVWFKDAFGHLSQVKSGTIIFDTKLPHATITSHPANPTNSTLAKFTFIATKPGSKFQCQLDDGAYSACTSTTTYEGLHDGQHIFSVKATDAVGNADLTPDSFTWTIDTVPPDTTITSRPPAQTESASAHLAFNSTKTGSTFQCQLDGSNYAACTSPQGYAGLAEGTHSFSVKATDAIGNVDPTPASYSWTIAASFSVIITDHPPDPSDSESASFSFQSNKAGSTFSCQIDDGSFSACNSPMTYAGLTEGSHTFGVLAVAAAGNEESKPARYTWAVSIPHAEIPPEVDLTKILDSLPIPGSPAFAAIGVTPPLITRPASPRKLSFSALAGNDQNGTFQTAIAVDMSPYLLMKGSELSLEQYQKSARERDLSRLQLSIAASKGQMANDTVTRFATAARWIIWDDGDIRLDQDLVSCIAMEQQEEEIRRSEGGGPAGALRTGCSEKIVRRNWNKSAADAGLAINFINEEGKGGGFNSDGINVWSSVAYGFDRFEQMKDNSQITVLARYRLNEAVPTADFTNRFYTRDRLSLGFLYRYGEPQLALLLQGQYLRTNADGQSGDSFRSSIGGEYELLKGIWMELEIGRFLQTSSQDNPSFITMQFKWAAPEKMTTK